MSLSELLIALISLVLPVAAIGALVFVAARLLRALDAIGATLLRIEELLKRRP